MAFTQDFRTQRRNYEDGDTRIGEKDRLWYDSVTNTIRISDGETPGGIVISGGGSGGSYTLPTASTTVKGGVKVDGTTITINNQVISGFSGHYHDLSGAPSIPTKVSDLTNDTGFITGVTWDAVTSKPTLFSGTYADLSGKPTLYSSAYIGTTNLDFTRSSASQTLTGVSIDGNAATVTNGLYSTGEYADPVWLTSLAYSKLTGAPTVPTNLSELTNDSGYITDSVTALSSLTSVGTLDGLTVSKSTTGGAALSITAATAPIYGNATWQFIGNSNVSGPKGWIQFPDSTIQTTAWTGTVSYDNLSDLPTLFSGSYNDLTDTPTLFSGSYTDLTDKPTIPTTVTVNGTSITLGSSGTVTAAAGTLTGTTLNSTVVTSSLTSVGTLTNLSVTNTITGSVSGNAGTVTNGVYTTDTGTVTNTMLAGSIANAKLSNSSVTINGTSVSLGASATVTAAAGTLTGSTLASGVTASSLTSVGTLTGVTSNAATAFIAGDAAISGVALQIPREGAIRNLYNGANTMYFDVSIGGAPQGSFQFRSSSSYTNVLTMSSTGVNFNTGAPITGQTPSVARLAWNSVIDTELTIDDYRFRVSNSGGIFPQIISNTGGTKDTAWTAVGAISGSAVAQAGSTGNLVPNNSWVSLYTLHGMDNAGDTVTVTLQDKSAGRIYRVTFMRSNNAIVGLTGYNIIAERLL